MTQELRPYDRDRDLDAVRRIWREIGWTESEEEDEALDGFLDGSNVEVGCLDGTAECSVAWVPGSIRYDRDDLPLCLVTAVTTSRIARKHGFATTMTARAIRAGADAGAAVASLGMFEQGFYDRLGFGTGAYLNQVTFDPGQLALDHIAYRRTPVRLTGDDHAELHGALMRRTRRHGGIVIDPADVFEAELKWLKKPFGLGYRNEEGRLTHAMVGESNGAHGPYSIRYLTYEEPGQLLELLRLLQELADQVTTVKVVEPPEVQLQDLIRGPILRATVPQGPGSEGGIRALAFFQQRILDLDACIAARTWSGRPVRCNLRLTDPATAILARADDDDRDAGRWQGVGGDHVLTVGASSTVSPGHDPSLPTLSASIGAFSRCWFAVRPATSLAITDDLSAPDELLDDLDRALALPPPIPGWDH